MVSVSSSQGVSGSRLTSRTYGWYMALLIPMLLHLWLVYRFSVNVPYIDDYTFLADCLHWQRGALSVTEKLKHLFHPHGEHIILFARFVVLADQWLEGALNFRTLFLVGNATLFGTVWLLYRLARQSSLKPWQFLPVVLLLFQPQSYENTLTWAICALQHLPALFFAFLAFDLISRPAKWAFWVGLPVAFLGLFSNGNGMAVLVGGLLLLLVQRQRIRLLIWIVFTILSAGLFFYVHHLYQSPAADSNLTHPIRVLGGFFLMAGSMGLVFTRSIVGLSLIGLCITACIGFVVLMVLLSWTGFNNRLTHLPTRFRQRLNRWSALSVDTPSLVLATSYLYVLITLGGISFARSLGWYQGLLLPRFIWFATVGVAVGYLLVILWLRPVYQDRFSRIAFVLSLLFNGMAYWFNFGEVMTIRQSQLSDLHNWRETGILITMPANSRQHGSFYSDILRAAVDQKMYHLPPSILEPALRQALSPTIVPRFIEKDSSFVLGNRTIRSLSIGGLPPARPFDTRETYLLLQSGKHTFMWPVNRSLTKLPEYLLTGKSNWANDMVWIFTDQLPADTYRPDLILSTNKQWMVVRNKQFLRTGMKSSTQ